jgi:hypothetical protein
MARKVNSQLLEQYDPEPVFERLYLNALGQLDPPLKQNEIISIREVLDRYIPKIKALELDMGDSSLVVNLVSQVSGNKPADS